MVARVLFAAALVFATTEAAAQYSPYPPYQPPVRPPPVQATASDSSHDGLGDGYLLLDFDVRFDWLRTPPAMPLFTPNGVKMTQFGDQALKSNGAMLMLGFNAMLALRLGVVTVPLLGGGLGIPVAVGYPKEVDLGIPWERADTSYYAAIDLPGLGVFVESGSIGVGANVRTGFSYVRNIGSITQGLLTVDAEGHIWNFALRGDVDVCYLFDKHVGACFFVAPFLYEQESWLNGGAMGLRVKGF